MLNLSNNNKKYSTSNRIRITLDDKTGSQYKAWAVAVHDAPIAAGNQTVAIIVD